MPVYPGHVKTVVWQNHSHVETEANFEGGFSYQANGMLLSDHGPTHVDSISHFDPRPDAPSIDQMPLDLFHGPGVCLDVSHKAPAEYVTAADLDEACAAAGAEVRPGAVVLIRTGTHDRVGGTAEYQQRYPGLDDGASAWLADHEVKIFGVDSPSPDHPMSPSYPCHMMCRARGVTHYENLANLAELVGRDFEFMGFPLRIRGGTGSPVRAVAVVDDGDGTAGR
jgi:kynurenine formamidase